MPLLRGEQALLVRLPHCRGPRLDAQLAVDGDRLGLHSSPRHVEVLAYLLEGHVGRQVVEHPQLCGS